MSKSKRSRSRRPSAVFLILATLMILIFVGGLAAILMTAAAR